MSTRGVSSGFSLFVSVLVFGIAASPLGATAAGAPTRAVTSAGPAPCTATWTDGAITPVGTEDNVMYSVAGTSYDDLYATGRWFPNTSDSYSARFLRNNGTGWTDLTIPNLHANTVFLTDSAAEAPANAWAAGWADGQAVLLHALGSTVTQVALPAPPPGFPEADSDQGPVVASSGHGDVWVAVTYFPTGGGPEQARLYSQRRDGTWRTPIVPGTYVDTLAALGPDDIYVGGSGLHRWTEGNWTTVALPGNPPYVQEVVANGAEDVFVLAADTSGKVMLDHFDGTSWTTVSQPALGLPNQQLNHLALAPTGQLWVTGTYDDPITSYIQSWAGRYDPVRGSWAAGAASPSAPDAGGATGGVSQVLALSDRNVLIAGWGSGQKLPVVARNCGLTIGARATEPRSLTTDRPGDAVLAYGGVTAPPGVTLTDRTGLLTAGPLAPGAAVALQPFAAGTYRVQPSTGKPGSAIGVPVLAMVDGQHAVVNVATKHAPAGYAYRLQLMTPGSSTWRTVALTPSTGGIAKVLYRAQWPSGTYSARAMVRNTRTGVTTGWSPVVTFAQP